MQLGGKVKVEGGKEKHGDDAESGDGQMRRKGSERTREQMKK